MDQHPGRLTMGARRFSDDKAHDFLRRSFVNKFVKTKNYTITIYKLNMYERSRPLNFFAYRLDSRPL